LYDQWPTKYMIKQTSSSVFFSIVATLGLITPAHADIVATVGSYDSPDGYDYATTFPTPGQSTTVGTFTFTPPAEGAAGITVSGSFGNGDVPNTALSDYYLGFAGNETAVEVSACDDILANCYSGQEGPYNWSATLTPAEIALLAPAIADGSIDFTYTWDNSPPAQPIPDIFSPTGYDDQYVYAGAATLDITPAPEPGTVLLCFSGLAGLAAFRRFRKL